MWPGFDCRTWRHMSVEFVVGSLLCSERFFSGYSGFPLSSKTNITKLQFDPGMHILNEVLRTPRCSSLLFCLRDGPLIVFRRQNHVTVIFIKTMSHDLLVQVAYYNFKQSFWIASHPASSGTTHAMRVAGWSIPLPSLHWKTSWKTEREWSEQIVLALTTEIHVLDIN